MDRNARTQAIESASALILARGCARDRELRAYYLARGRFTDVIALGARLAPVTLRLVA